MMITVLLAVYGALLSTILAWLEYRRGRPLARIIPHHPMIDEFINVSIENRSEVDIVLRRVRVLLGGDVGVFTGDSLPETIRDAVDQGFGLRGGHGKVVPAGEKSTLTFRLREELAAHTSYVVLISWMPLSGLAVPKIPLVVRLPRAELERLAAM
jgi:hypothetical protein